MADWAQTVGAKFETAGAVTASSRGTQVTAAASANTKGSYAQLIASTAFTADAILVGIQNNSSAGVDFLTDLAVGGAGSEQVVVSNLYHVGANTLLTALLPFPISIPAGSRVAARSQASTLSESTFLQVLLVRGGFAAPAGLSRVTTYGANTTDSGGVGVDAGAVLNTKGAWSEITASTTNPIRHLILRLGNQLVASRQSGQILLDLAVGAASSEQVVVSNLPAQTNTSESVQPETISLPLSIPAGTRLAARAQCSSTNTSARNFDVIVYGCD